METRRFMNRKNQQTTLKVSDECLRYSGFTIDQLTCLAKGICDTKNITFVTPEERRKLKQREEKNRTMIDLIMPLIMYIIKCATFWVIIAFVFCAVKVITGVTNEPNTFMLIVYCSILYFIAFFDKSKFIDLLRNIRGS